MTPDSQSNDDELPAAIEPQSAFFGAETRSSRVGRFTRLATYTSMGNVVSRNIEQLLVQIRQSIPDRAPSGEIKQEFFNHFLMVTDRFAAKCSSEFANIIRTSSVQANVRAIPQEILSKRIRDSAFHDLDAILLTAVAILRELHIDISEALGNLKESSLHDLITGKVEHKKPLDEDDEQGGDDRMPAQDEEAIPIEEPVHEEEISPELQQQQEALRAQGQALAFSKALDYIKTVGTLPTVLVDYGSRKCFGGDMDFEMQKNAVTQIENAIEQRRAKAIAALIDLACAERRLVEKAPQPQAQSQSDHMTMDMDGGVEGGGNKGQAAIGLIVAGVCLVPAGMMMILHSNKKYAMFLGAIGFMGLFFALVQSMSKRSDTEDMDRSAIESETSAAPMEQTEDLPPPASPSE